MLYIFTSEAFARIVFEVIAGRDEVTITRDRQYAFYALLALEYAGSAIAAISAGKFGVDRRRIGMMIVVCAAMIVQGVLMGVAWGNQLLPILVQTINVGVVLANVYLLSDSKKLEAASFRRLLIFATGYATVMLFFAVAGGALGRRIPVDFGSAAADAIVVSVLLAALTNLRNVFDWRVLTLGAAVGATFGEWNRTTLLFIGVGLAIVLVRNVVRSTVLVLTTMLVVVLVLAAAPILLPPDSKLEQRIVGLQNVDLDEREGSIGERQAEADSVAAKIDGLGWAGRLLGAGHGAVYDVQYTWEVKTDYENAHFSWVLFYLRYGLLGYAYLGLWALMLVVSLVRNLAGPKLVSVLLAFLALYNLIYLGTYAYFSFFICGLNLVRPEPSVAPVRQGSGGRRQLI